jgi:hypothetical protein
MYESRQDQNEMLGLYCYCSEDNPRESSLWREADDGQLTPWLDVGPDGMIWAVWNDGDEYMLVLEERDDAASPPVLRQALMHLPSGRRTDFIFAGDHSYETQVGVECVSGLGNEEVLLLTLPHDVLERDDCLGAALYDRNLRELIAPSIRYISRDYGATHCVTVAITRPDLSVGWGIFNYREAVFVVPADYDEVKEHQGRWLCNQGDSCDVFDKQGVKLARYPYTLYLCADENRLQVKRDGLWGWADNEGRITVEPFANDSAILDAEPKRFSRLSLSAAATSPFCLEPATLAALVEATGELGICIKYEGVARSDGGDGMLDIMPAELPGGATGLFLEDRWGEARYVVLIDAWRKLVAGTVLAVQGRMRALTVSEDGPEAGFLLDVFAQSVELG